MTSHSEHQAKDQLEGPVLTGGGTGKKCGRKKDRMAEEEEDKGN